MPALAYPVLTFVLDAGALIAVDRGDREVLSMLQTAFEHGYSVRVPASVVGQVWRNPNRQVVLARTLERCNEVALDGGLDRAAGRLCGWVGTSDVIDASVAIVASHTDHLDNEVVLLTSDASDIGTLLSEVRTKARIVNMRLRDPRWAA